MLREPSFAMFDDAVVNCEVLGRFNSIPLVPPPLASCCLDAALLERLDVLDDDVDATARLLLATALVEVDDETWSCGREEEKKS